MIALIEDNRIATPNITVVSANDDDRLKSQIERVIESQFGASVWAKLYVDMETVDFGGYQITVFPTDSLIRVDARTNITTLLNVERESHNLHPL